MARCYLPLPVGARDDNASENGSEHGNEQENAIEGQLVNGNAESKDGSVADKVRYGRLDILVY